MAIDTAEVNRSRAVAFPYLGGPQLGAPADSQRQHERSGPKGMAASAQVLRQLWGDSSWPCFLQIVCNTCSSWLKESRLVKLRNLFHSTRARLVARVAGPDGQ